MKNIKTRAELKQTAISNLKGNWFSIICANIINNIINYIILNTGYIIALILVTLLTLLLSTFQINEDTLSIITGFSYVIITILITFISFPLFMGLIFYQLDFVRSPKADLSLIFKGYKYFFKSIFIVVIMNILTFLWSLLLIIPGIIKSLSYSMAPYILADNPEIKPLDAITKSKELMDGHKSELFLLQLSFIGWGLLTILTFGIGLLWLIPYIQITTTNFYLNLIEETTVPNITTIEEVIL